jgi:hypothetical protein
MTTCFQPLPIEYKDLFFVDDLLLKIKNLNITWKEDRHDWTVVSDKLFLTKEGKDFFSEYTFVNVFHLPAGISSRIHTDNAAEAVNFILGNRGVMQWYDIESLTPVKSFTRDGIKGPTVFESSNPIVISETDLDLIKVNPRIPHRIINQGSEDRFCISLRKNEN